MGATKKPKEKSKDFDYFYVLLKNWKTILIVCVLAVGISLSYILISPKKYASKTSFSITLDEAYESSYGMYNLKTTNPLHYLTSLKQQKFIDTVLRKVDSENFENVNFEIEAEEPIQDLKALKVYQPNKFDFIVSGSQEEDLDKISTTALSLFIEKMDDKILNGMFNQFYLDLNIEIDTLKLAMQIKQELINELKESLGSGVQIETDETNYKELIDDRLINNLDGSERGLIVSMMLSGNKGSRHYQETVLAVEEVRLRVIKNKLEKKESMLAILKKNKKEETLGEILKRPFSNSFIVLASPEKIKSPYFKKNLKLIIGSLIIAFLMTTFVLLMRAYVSSKYN